MGGREEPNKPLFLHITAASLTNQGYSYYLNYSNFCERYIDCCNPQLDRRGRGCCPDLPASTFRSKLASRLEYVRACVCARADKSLFTVFSFLFSEKFTSVNLCTTLSRDRQCHLRDLKCWTTYALSYAHTHPIVFHRVSERFIALLSIVDNLLSVACYSW